MLTIVSVGCLPADPPREAPEQHGVALVTYSLDGYDSLETKSYLQGISRIGANWVQLDPTWYQARRDGSAITPQPNSPSDISVERAISLAHNMGLKVLLKPHVDLLDQTDRGTIRPAQPTDWFASYMTFITHYADLAARTQVEEFTVGTELAGVSSNRAGWLRVIQAVRDRYTGPIVYAANFTEYSKVSFWDAVDLIGIDAYWKLSDQPTADVTTLERAWAPIRAELNAFSSRQGRKILFTEAGYTSQRGTTTAPWSWAVSATPDQAEQAAGYQALLATFQHQPWWSGVFWWAWDVLPGGPVDPLSYTPHDKSAEQIVRQWWIKRPSMFCEINPVCAQEPR